MEPETKNVKCMEGDLKVVPILQKGLAKAVTNGRQTQF